MPENKNSNTGVPSSWRLPGELQRHVPRPVELSGAGKAVVVLIVALAIGAVALAVFLNYLRQRDLQRDAILESSGFSARATVNSTGIESNKQRLRYVVYRYSVDGEEYVRRVTLRRADRRPAGVGSTIDIRYLPGQPAESWPVGYGPQGPPLVVVILIPVLMAFGSWAMVYTMKTQRRLLSEGRATEGRVKEVRRFGRGSESSIRVEYEFKLLSGATQIARAQVKRNPPSPGDAATILYDPDDPRKIAVYPVSLVRIASEG